jgi:hypothetical protein
MPNTPEVVASYHKPQTLVASATKGTLALLPSLRKQDNVPPYAAKNRVGREQPTRRCVRSKCQLSLRSHKSFPAHRVSRHVGTDVTSEFWSEIPKEATLRRSTRLRRAQEMKCKDDENEGSPERQRAAPKAGLGEPNAKAPQVAKDPTVPVPWRAPVARMY